MRKIMCLCLVCIIPFALGGCYDHREVDTVATVMAVGIEEGEKEGQKVYTFALSDTGGIMSGSSGDGTSLICFSQKAEDIESAVYELNKKLSRSLSFSHVSAIFFSQETAGNGMYRDISFFERDYKVRPQAIIAVSKLSPLKYLEGLTPRLEANPEKYFRSMFMEGASYVPTLQLGEFTDSYHSDKTCLVPILTVKTTKGRVREEDSVISVVGTVRKGRLVIANGNEPFIGLFFSDKTVKSTDATLKRRGKPKVMVNIKKQKVTVEITAECEGSINPSEIKKSGEKFLWNMAQKGIDVINVRTYGKKEFYTAEEYNKYEWSKFLKNAEFELEIKIAEKGEI